jgi:hypothetical protein
VVKELETYTAKVGGYIWTYWDVEITAESRAEAATMIDWAMAHSALHDTNSQGCDYDSINGMTLMHIGEHDFDRPLYTPFFDTEPGPALTLAEAQLLVPILKEHVSKHPDTGAAALMTRVTEALAKYAIRTAQNRITGR